MKDKIAVALLAIALTAWYVGGFYLMYLIDKAIHAFYGVPMK